MKRLLAAMLVAAPAAAFGQATPTPLFASDVPIRLTIQGPVNAIARNAEDSIAPRNATLLLAETPETHAIQLAARGISRRRKVTCDFPPLRVELMQKPAASSLFAGQRRLKLVTHCRSSTGFQQYLLLEFAAYRLFNAITPLSYKVRLATVDYAEPDGKVSISRLGFFIEDLDDLARRNGLPKAQVGDVVASRQLEPRQAARVALFQYMIGNLDWSMRAGPKGEGCCHNSRLLKGAGGLLVPVVYDFDYSGMVDAPYAVPPDKMKVDSVRERSYQGYCHQNAEVLAAAAELRAGRPAIEAVFSQIPGMEDRTRRKALGYLAGFFNTIATDESVKAKILKDCVG